MKSFKSLNYQVSIYPTAHTAEAEALLPDGLIRLISELHSSFESERQQLLGLREARQKEFDSGKIPQFEKSHPAHETPWKVAALPEDIMERRVEITGPANSTKMVINMLSPNSDGVVADMAMIDFEDSMKPTWGNVISALQNIIGVAKGNLSFESNGKSYHLDPKQMAHPMIRVRGLHLNEANIQVNGLSVSAGIFDLAASAYHTSRLFLKNKSTPLFYVPKCEHYLESRWWNKVFAKIEQSLDLAKGSLRVTYLIETLTAAFQMEEILYESRERAAGLNGGRWDKIFSDIKTLKNHSDKVLANRSFITMTVPWMENYAKRLIQICHKHGAFAMGGMSAFTPGKDEETRKLQTERVKADKAREFSIGHDGCWVSHPYFIGIARNEFKKKNQLEVLLNDFSNEPDLIPKAIGPKTLDGLRTNVRVGIAYMQGWNLGLGCVAFDNLMEDLATLEISRTQTWQWLHHKVKLDDGTEVSEALVSKVFDEECDKIISEMAPTGAVKESFVQAKLDARRVFLKPQLDNFLTTTSELANS